MGKENTCCFTGHRDILADRLPVVSTKLRTEILQAISDGYTHFICGFASGASLIFAALVAEFKKGCPLVLEAAIPYPAHFIIVMPPGCRIPLMQPFKALLLAAMLLISTQAIILAVAT